MNPIYFFIYPEAYYLATQGEIMNPEPLDETPSTGKPEIRGGDKFEDLDFDDTDYEHFWGDDDS